MIGQTKFLLTEREMPTSWYNVAADLPSPPPPPLHPGTGAPVGPDDLALIREVVAGCAGLSRRELAHTVCELLGWTRPQGTLKGREAREDGADAFRWDKAPGSSFRRMVIS